MRNGSYTMRHQEFKERRSRVDLKKMKALDFLLIAAILLGSAGWLLAARTDANLGYPDFRDVVVYHDGVIGERVEMDTDKLITLLQGKMILEVLDNRIRIKRSDCPRQHCVHQGWATYEGESIICVPFKTLIEIQSSARPKVDAVVY